MVCVVHRVAIGVPGVSPLADSANRDRETYARTTITEQRAWRTTLAAFGPRR
jgi:hypothetical protein